MREGEGGRKGRRERGTDRQVFWQWYKSISIGEEILFAAHIMKFHLKWITELNKKKAKTIKRLEENRRKSLWFGFENDILKNAKSPNYKGKSINCSNKSFALQKTLPEKWKNKTKKKKVFVRNISNNGLVFRIYNELRSLNSKTTQQKIGKNLNRYLTKKQSRSKLNINSHQGNENSTQNEIPLLNI